MANTVVGIFEYEDDAQQAQNYLLANGYADGDVDIKTASYKSDTGTGAAAEDRDVSDRIGNFFRDLFDGDEQETQRYTDAGRKGTIVTVHALDATEAEAAAEILDRFGALDVNDENFAGFSTADQTYNTPDTGFVPVTGSTLVTDPTLVTDSTILPDSDSLDDESFVSGNESASLPVIEEELQVSKREIETGGVRLRSRIIERPVQESVRLRQEQVTVTRTPVDRIASVSELDTFAEGTIEMTERAEIPVVTKEARVVEEVSLNKTVEEHDEIIHDTVRNTEIDVEDLTDEENLRRSGLDL
ncbi:YsnF/AvaK domain-containing protein [Dyadobacter sp. CY261]|uniref:YsnF/AvaK domain-containing protein n=1 Tax=Dyadobacter sp. CY261 TaxID=2907203 RepID=UPI001F43D8F0|nr:YsnF/AvaK domain-containing protein [Dyadobacter sp. CY261]MCF0074175.1 YsnF/AvaK domain-containing protein [Dyadobacter sp. CY261]